MRWIASLAVIGALAIVRANGAEETSARFYVQLVRSANNHEALPPGVRPIGAKLKEKFGSPFKAGNYWETKREEVVVRPGHATKVALSPERSVEIGISGNRRTVTTYYNGRATERRSGPKGDGMTLIGDNRGGALWFVVVRKDRPGS